jgi:hypothetical protein
VAPALGTRGADLVRAALVEHGIPQVPARGPASDAPAEAALAEAAPAASGKTLADVRRERQAAAKAAGNSAEEDPAVQAATAARRERQAAAQSAGQASAPGAASEPMAETSAAAPAVAGEAAPVAVPGAAPTPVVEEPARAAEALAPTAEAVPTVAVPVGSLPPLAELLAVWQPMLESMSGRVRSRFSAGHWVETTADSVNFGLPNPVHRDRCEEVRVEVDEALVVQFGRAIPLSLVVDMVEEEPDFFSTPPSGGAGTTDDADDGTFEEDSIDVHGLVDATGDVLSAEDRVMTTFENSILLEDPQNNFPNP